MGASTGHEKSIRSMRTPSPSDAAETPARPSEVEVLKTLMPGVFYCAQAGRIGLAKGRFT